MSTLSKNRFSLWRRAACSLLFLFLLSAISAAADIEINSDYLEYDEVARFMIARGSVTITWENKILKGDQIRLWVESKHLLAENNVTFVENKNVLFADSLAYDYQADSATILNASGYADPQYFSAGKIVRKGSTTYETEGIVVTNCDVYPPHYVVRASRARITLNKRIVMYNAVMYLGKTPIFYLPVFTSALGAHRSNLEITPGYNNQDGLTIKAIYGYPFSDNLYGKLYLDYLGKRGWGEGGELTYSSTTMRGTVYAYHLDDKRNESESLNIRTEYWQRLNPFWTAQADVDYITDKSANNSHYIENKRIDNRIHSFAAATRQDRKSNLRIVAETYNFFDAAAGLFVTEVLTIPSISYTLFPQKGNMPFYTSFSASIQDQYTRANGYYTMNGNADLNITRDIRLTRQLTYKPQVGVREAWVNRSPAGESSDQFLTSYYTNNNFRLRVMRWMDWDLSHSLAWQTLMNSLLLDPDGETSNIVSYVNTMSFGKLRVKDSISYNMHLYRISVVDDWRTPFTPLVNELYWSPRQALSLFAREENAVYPFVLNSVQVDARMGQADTRYLNLGVFYQYAKPDDLDLTSGFGFWPTKKWKLDYALHWTIVNRFENLIAEDHEFKLYRDLHCWESSFSYRCRPDGFEEIYFKIGLKSAARENKRYPTRDAREFYPWR